MNSTEREYPNRDLDSVLADAPDDGFLDTSIRPWLTRRDFEAGLSRLCARYDAGVVEADRNIDYLRDQLEKRGQLEDTALIVCSDHGESLYEHDIFADHHGLYDETMHVPLVVTTPDTRARRHDELVQLPDIAPPITDILGVDSSPGAFGRSLLPLLEGSGWNEREALYAEEAHTQRRTAVRTDGWKYIQHTADEALPTDGMECRHCERVHGPPPELYDLEQDPEEQRNVVDVHPDVVDRLRDSYENLLDTLPALDEEGRSVEYDDEEDVLDQLERLGYR
jgi:arylsulfatase A-like enzyme